MQSEIKEMFEYAEKLNKLPLYWAVEIDNEIKRRKALGHDIISLGIGDPDLPTPPHIRCAAHVAIENVANHRYPDSEGMLSFREAVAYRIKEDYGIVVDPKKEVTSLIGSKEGLVHVQSAFINHGDYALYPVIGYSPNWIGTILAGGVPYPMSMTKENEFLPDLESVPSDIAKKAKMMIINYPNNPTGAVATKEFYKHVVDFAKDNGIIVVSDEAYSKTTFDGYRHKSFLETSGAKDIGIVLDSLSKAYSMTGWRIGYAYGNEKVIAGLLKVKTNIDSGASQIIQEAAIAALKGPQDCVKENLKIYQERREIAKRGLEDIGIDYFKTPATFYLWCWRDGQDGFSLANEFLNKDVVVSSGRGFVSPENQLYAKDFIRISLTQKTERIKEVFKRMGSELYA